MTVSIQHHQREEHYQAKYQSLSNELKGNLEESCPGIGISHILFKISPQDGNHLKIS